MPRWEINLINRAISARARVRVLACAFLVRAFSYLHSAVMPFTFTDHYPSFKLRYLWVWARARVAIYHSIPSSIHCRNGKPKAYQPSVVGGMSYCYGVNRNNENRNSTRKPISWYYTRAPLLFVLYCSIRSCDSLMKSCTSNYAIELNVCLILRSNDIILQTYYTLTVCNDFVVFSSPIVDRFWKCFWQTF